MLAMGLTKGDRRSHQSKIIAQYHRALTTHGVSGYGIEQCECDVRLGFSASLMTNVVAAASMDASLFAASEAETGMTFVYGVFDRLADAFSDNDVIAMLP